MDEKFVDMFKINKKFFASLYIDMLGIHLTIVAHELHVNPKS